MFDFLPGGGRYDGLVGVATETNGYARDVAIRAGYQ